MYICIFSLVDLHPAQPERGAGEAIGAADVRVGVLSVCVLRGWPGI